MNFVFFFFLLYSPCLHLFHSLSYFTYFLLCSFLFSYESLYLNTPEDEPLLRSKSYILTIDLMYSIQVGHDQYIYYIKCIILMVYIIKLITLEIHTYTHYWHIKIHINYIFANICIPVFLYLYFSLWFRKRKFYIIFCANYRFDQHSFGHWESDAID